MESLYVTLHPDKKVPLVPSVKLYEAMHELNPQGIIGVYRDVRGYDLGLMANIIKEASTEIFKTDELKQQIWETGTPNVAGELTALLDFMLNPSKQKDETAQKKP